MRAIPLTGLATGIAAILAVSYFTLAHRGQHTPSASGSPLHPQSSDAAIRGAATDRVASLPDHGVLLEFAGRNAVRKGAYTLHPVDVSEEHALRSIGTGQMVLRSPAGKPIALELSHKVEHADGNWTWVGHLAGGKPGSQAVITFGDKAVFGSIPQPNGAPLELGTASGRTWLVETDVSALPKNDVARDADFLAAPDALTTLASSVESSGAATSQRAPLPSVHVRMPLATASSAAQVTSAMTTSPAASTTQAPAVAPPGTTVDLVVGYTNDYAARLGSASAAVSRLTHLVDLANEAFTNTQSVGRLRLMGTVQVDYPDNTANRTALAEMTGVQCTSASGPQRVELPTGGQSCTPAEVPAALKPLVAARERFGADVVSLVRTFQDPENQSCGVAWMLGGGQLALDARNAPYGFSVVSDSGGNQFPDPDTNQTCRSETLAHEIGHNLGLQHEVEVAQGSLDRNGDGNLLDPEEYGRYVDSFGYMRNDGAGNFYTLMAARRDGADAYLVFSNPSLNFCGGLACGIAGQADNARTLAQTLPMVAAFRLAAEPTRAAPKLGDYDGDGRADVWWRELSTGANLVWKSANSGTAQAVSAVSDLAWMVAASGDFNGDGKSDVLWRHNRTGQNAIWRSGLSTTPQAVSTVSQGWFVAGVGDFDGNGQSDVLWRNALNGTNAIWRSANSATSQAISAVTDQTWRVVGVGDFNGDGRDDILWRNVVTGANLIWRSGASTQMQAVTTVPNLSWAVAGIADFDGDGKSDLLWRNSSTGQNAIWKSASSTTPQAVATVSDVAWTVAGVGDFDLDGKADVLWRHARSGANAIWRSANSATASAVTPVGNYAWSISG